MRRIAGCNLTKNSCKYLTSALQSENCSLKHLELNKNDIQDSGVEQLSAGLKSSYCKLETLSTTPSQVTYRSFLMTQLLSGVLEREEDEYRTLVDDFVEWSGQNHLRLNISKTREMVIDFRRKKTPSQPLKIKGEVVEDVEDYKYLGVVIGNRLDWSSNTDAVCKKGMSRLYFLRKLRSINVYSKMLETFYHSVVDGAIFFAAVSWGSSIRASDSNRLDKIIKKAVALYLDKS